MIYDCFNFFNELEILDIRLNTLYDVIDKFVLVESNKTHSGLPKGYIFDINKKKFSKFLDKIIHIKLDDVPDDYSNLVKKSDHPEYNKIVDFINSELIAFNKYSQPHYGRDYYQKEAICFGLTDCNDDDIIISSDCDEIVNPEILNKIENYDIENYSFVFEQIFYMYYLNVINLSETPWYGSRIGKYKNLKNISYNRLRIDKLKNIKNGGWHFSYMGGISAIKEKIESYSAQEFNNNIILDNLSINVKNNNDILLRDHKLRQIELDNTYPKYLLDNKSKFKHLIKT